MSSLNRVSTLVESQLPEFIRSDYPVFVEFLEKYYEFLEQPGNPVYELKTFQNNYDIDLTREGLLRYFRNKILPSFPEESELTTERIIKSARDFYTKKGTPDSFQFLFRVLYDKDLDIYFPKLQIFKASDGKWVLPQAFRLSSSPANESVNLNLLKNQKATGSISRATCIIERAYKTIDLATNREIYEVYVSSITRTFTNNELLEIPYIDENGDAQVFSETIIGSISNIKINPRRRGRRYIPGDPVVINGGQNLNSLTRQKAVAYVGNVTTATIDSVLITKRGYGFRTFPNSFIDIITANPITGALDGTGNGVLANITVDSLQTGANITIDYCTDSIFYKANLGINSTDYDFPNTAPTDLFFAATSGSTQLAVNIANDPSLNVTNDFYNGRVIKVVEGTGSDGSGSKINTVVIADYTGATRIATLNANTSIQGTVNISGVNVYANTTYPNIADFTAGEPGFYTYLTAGKTIEINGELRTINAVMNSTHLDVTVAFSSSATDKKLNANSTLTSTLDGTSSLQLTSSAETGVGSAFSFETLNVAPIGTTVIVSGGADFEGDPPATLNVVAMYESDYSSEGFITLNPGSHFNYNNVNASIRFSGAGFSSTDGWYVGRRIKLESQYRRIIAYDGATKTAFLNRIFETNINPINILSKTMRLDNRPSILGMGQIANVEISSGGTGYMAGDPITFIGTGYGAAAQVQSIGVGGAVAAVTLTNRGAGYFVPPTATAGGSGTGATFNVVLVGDGEDLTANASSLGAIIDFNLVNRGSDYVSTPNVSLKIYDLSVTGNTTNISSIQENDFVYQGTPSAQTFTGIVDSVLESNSIIRVFNYSGTPIGGGVVVTRTDFTGTVINVHNSGIIIANANVSGKQYPYRYGNGRARANAEFLNGLIRYNGFYLNTDGHISSDKRLQDDDRYHNFSYALSSEESFDTYRKTIFDVVHPTGTKLLPIHVIPEDYKAEANVSLNQDALITTDNTLIGNCSVAFNSNNVIGGLENFDTIANVNDLIVINSANTHRSFNKIITVVANNNSLNIESPCVMVGEGRAHISSGNASIVIKGNSNIIARFISTNDRIRLKVDGSTLLRSINTISGNVVTLNSNVGITNTTNLTIDTTNKFNYGKETVPALVYEVIPQFSNVDYKIIRTN
jgi:hypothetical protein